MAIGSLVTGILSLLCVVGCLGIVLGPGAAMMGLASRQRVAASGSTLGGHSIATAGLVLGIIGFVANVAWLVAVLKEPSFWQFLKAP